ncbi:MAG: lysophospholipid acyltransferase family protein [Bacteroidales bacterium]|nr:lysophospholipid acyltransferase family protein [Bacteroidales bacterium]
MKKIGYYIFITKAWFISLLPFRFLYVLSDFLFVIVYHLVRYRRKVTSVNLTKSFPGLGVDELKRIEKKYYHNLCDIIVEVIKIRHITPDQLKKRMVVTNPEILYDLFNRQKSVFLAVGHCGNWDWFGKTMPYITQHKVFAIYKELNSNDFDGYMKSLRSRFGVPSLIESKATYRSLLQAKDTVNAVFLAGDQTPGGLEANYWTSFLNQDTPFFVGIEKMAKSLDYAVLFFDIQRIRRGYYEATISPVSLNPKETKTNEITGTYVRLLEKAIVENPENWLWSHRRWKHKRERVTN